MISPRPYCVGPRATFGLYLTGVLWLVMCSPLLKADSRDRGETRASSSRHQKVDATRQNDLMIVQIPTGSTARTVWRSNIALGSESEGTSTQELLSLIHRLNAFQFQGREPSPAPVTEPVPVPNSPAPTTVPETNQPPEPVKTAEKESTVEAIDPNDIQAETRQTLIAISQEPQSLADPLALAELLFRAEHLDEAAVCYQEAFRRTTQQQDNAVDADWMLFQIGNCLRKSDPNAALVAYQQLITQYPESPWGPMARAKSKWIDWMLDDDPEGLLTTLP